MHLRAEMPDAVFTARGLMEVRIARKVACLSGIAGPPQASDAGAGRCWFSAYEALTLTEIVAGAPMAEKPPPGRRIHDAGVLRRVGRRLGLVDDPEADLWPIPNAALKAYGPSTKAALVLTGTNKVLEPVTDAVLTALHDVRRQIDSPHLLVAVAHCLIQEVFAAQPVLFLNGLQAARVQRALRAITDMVSRPEPPGGEWTIARSEHGWPQADPERQPLEFSITHRIWDELVMRGPQDRQEDLHDEMGLPIPAGPGNFLHLAADDHFAQNDPIAADHQGAIRPRMLSTLRHISEAVFLAAPRGGPRCSVQIVERAGGNAYTEVLIPRQRQVEIVLRRIADRLVDPAEGASGTVLPLPHLDVAAWRGAELLVRRAVVLAHYYCLRAAGWISGMPALDRRRSREACADRCRTLVDAAAELLDDDDPLRDQVIAYGLGYLQQYHSTFGRGAPDYQRLLDTLRRMHARVEAAEGRGRAVIWETLQTTLRELNTVRRAARLGLHHQPSEVTMTADLDHWWQVAHELRRHLITDRADQRYLDHEYGTYLVGAGSDSAHVEDGLKRLREVAQIRGEDAARSGRSLRIRMTKASLLRGLVAALAETPDDPARHDRAREIVAIADELERHRANVEFLDQRTRPGDPDAPLSYDGAALRLLTTLADGWVTAVRSGALSPDEQAAARERAAAAVRRMNEYLRRAAAGATVIPDASKVDVLRTEEAAAVTRRWTEHTAGLDGQPVSPA